MRDPDETEARPMPLSGWIRSGSNPAVPAPTGLAQDGVFWQRHESRYRDAIRATLRSSTGHLVVIDGTRLQGGPSEWRDPLWAVHASLLPGERGVRALRDSGVALVFDAPRAGVLDGAVAVRSEAPAWGFRADEGDGEVGQVFVASGRLFVGGLTAFWRQEPDDLSVGPDAGVLLDVVPGSWWVRVLRPSALAVAGEGSELPSLLVDLWPAGQGT